MLFQDAAHQDCGSVFVLLFEEMSCHLQKVREYLGRDKTFCLLNPTAFDFRLAGGQNAEAILAVVLMGGAEFAVKFSVVTVISSEGRFYEGKTRLPEVPPNPVTLRLGFRMHRDDSSSTQFQLVQPTGQFEFEGH